MRPCRTRTTRSGRVRAGLRILEAIGELNETDADLGLQVRIGHQHGRGGGRARRPAGVGRGDRRRRRREHRIATAGRGAGRRRGGVGDRRTGRRSASSTTNRWSRSSSRARRSRCESIGRSALARASAATSRARTRRRSSGRELEKSLLIGTFERAAQQRSCQLVTMVGEPGVGKSRLCAELLRHVDAPAGAGQMAAGPLPALRRRDRVLGAGGDRQGRVRHPRVGHAGGGGGEARAGVARGRPGRRRGCWPAWRRSSERRRSRPRQEESFAAWRRVLREPRGGADDGARVRGSALGRPGAARAFSSTWPTGRRACRCCSSARRGPSCTSGIRPSAANARNAQRINLAPLSDEETAQLVSTLLERAVLPAETQQTLLEQAGGNPLYAEEFVRLLADRGRLGDGRGGARIGAGT